MAIDPEIVGTMVGSAIVVIGFSGKYIYSRLLRPYGSNGDRSPFCQEHHHMVESVSSLMKEVKEGYGDLHEKVNATREAVARIEGMLQRRDP